VCIERSSPARRQRWNRLVAEALERDPRAGEVSHLLAKHFDAAGDAERAVPAYATAARHAGQRYATTDTIALCGRALALLPRLAASRERDLLEFQILQTMCAQVSSSSFKSNFGGREPLAVYGRAIEIARSLRDPAKVYAAITQLCSYHMIIAEYARVAELSPELEQIEQAHELDAMLLYPGIFARAYTAFFSGDLQTALRLLEKLVPAEQEQSVFHGNPGWRTVALGHLACVRWVLGGPDVALQEALATLALGSATCAAMP
jgi:tetratricopeptide (TPR) repeat protein